MPATFRIFGTDVFFVSTALLTRLVLSDDGTIEKTASPINDLKFLNRNSTSTGITPYINRIFAHFLQIVHLYLPLAQFGLVNTGEVMPTERYRAHSGLN